MEAERIETLEVLRALAFLGVFCSHIGFNAFISTGRWGVSVFFILTGFLLTYRYYGKGRITKDCGIKNNFGFLVRKIKRLFPLHEYYVAAEPPVRCGESHLSGQTEPPCYYCTMF